LLSEEGRRYRHQRFGRGFEELKKLWGETQWFSRPELEDFQNERLESLVRHAYETVPYYRAIMKERKLSPSDIKRVEDLRKLPILSKDAVRAHFKELISLKHSRLTEGHSSGTTGSPIDVLWDDNVVTAHNAAIWRNRSWAGFEFGRPYASLLGRVIVPIHQKKPPFWRYNKPWNQLFLSSFHLQEKNLPFYFQAMKRYEIEAIQAYPSTIYILARYLQQAGEHFPLKYIFTSSEPLLDLQREVIEEWFGCKVYDSYGLAERAMYGGECPRHEGHHLYMEYGIAEVVNEDNEVVEDGKYGKVIATGLNNYGMPLIRYEVGDVTAYKTVNCSCGRGLPLFEAITTKAEDIVVTCDGRFISASVLTHPFKPMNNIEKSQIIQETPEDILIKIVKRPGYTEKDTRILLKEMRNRVGDSMRIKVEFVEDIPRSGGGKYRWVVSKVPLKYKQKVFDNLYE
jgi:phenylacetate-CoA ligase